MKAGFSKVNINPPLGTRLTGLGTRDVMSGCQSIHDDIFVRALYCEQEGEACLIMSFDLCFVGREDADRFKGAIGRELDLLPRQILLNATHNHAGPAVGTWYWGDYKEPERLYLRSLEAAVLQAARNAVNSARSVTLRAGTGRSSLPVSRRLVVDGKAYSEPNPNGLVCDVLPVCLFEDEAGQPISLLFSVSTHPSLMRKWAVSADYCGVACDLLDEHLGSDVSLFLQGTGGDSKPSTIVDGLEWNWESDWTETQATGRILAEETIACLENGLQPVKPKINSALIETQWPLQSVERSYLEAVRDDASVHGDLQLASLWASRQLERWDHYGSLPKTAPVLMQGVQLGEGLRLVAFEGEPVAHYGHMMLNTFGNGVTFPLGYANGEALYLVTTPMLDEGAMEVESYYEYGFPVRLAAGMEATAADGIAELKRRGIT